jgi:chromosome segregation ATPase
MDVVTNFVAELFASTGLSANTALVLCTTVALAAIILSVVLSLSRRIDRLEGCLMDLRHLQATMHDTQTDHARVVSALGAVAGALPDLDGFKQYLRGANSQQSELIGTVGKVSIDLEGMRESVATWLLDTKSELMTLQESVRDCHPRMEMIQATLTNLQGEQRKLYKVLKAWNSSLKDMEQMVAAVPSIQTEQAGIKNELAEWNSRFDAVPEVLAEFLQSEDLPNEHTPTFDAPPNP